MTTKRKGDSVRRKLIDLSTKLHVPYRNIETAFLIERLVARFVADQNLGKHLVFKGGFVGLKVYNSPRYTVDLDALLVKSNIDSALKLTRENAESDLNDGAWFRFDGQANLTAQGEYGGIRQVFRAGIGELLRITKKAQVIHFDLGVGDPVTPGPKMTESPSLLSENEDISWSIYPVETIIAEKLHALITHGDANSRSKDVYDLAIFLPRADALILRKALKRCFEFRKTDLPQSISDILEGIDTFRLERGWPNAVASIISPPQFRTTFETVVRYIGDMEKALYI